MQKIGADLQGKQKGISYNSGAANIYYTAEIFRQRLQNIQYNALG